MQVCVSQANCISTTEFRLKSSGMSFGFISDLISAIEMSKIYFLREVLPSVMRVFVRIQGKPECLWQAVDRGGEVVDVFLHPRRDAKAVEGFLKGCFKIILGSRGRS